MRTAAKRDENEPEIVQALRKIGRHVDHLNDASVPDLLVIRPGRDIPVYVVESVEQALDVAMLQDDICLIEVKMPKTGRMTPKQKIWHGEVLLERLE